MVQHNPNFPLQITDQASLEIIREIHCEELFELITANRSYLRKWLPWVDRMRTLQQFREFVKDANKKAGEGLELGCVIKLNNELAGRSGIYNIDNSKGSATLGYWIAEIHQGKGLITSSCRALIQHSFNILQLKQLEIRCATNNVKSMAIAERLNFCRSGIIKNGEFFNHGFIDLFIYSLSKAEWQQQRETEH